MTCFYILTLKWNTGHGVTTRSWSGTLTANCEEQAFELARQFAVNNGAGPDAVTLFYYLGRQS